jgi:serine/threonine-protein kinase RsbW
MEINKKKEKGVVIVSVSGRIDAITAPDFEKNLAEVIGTGEKTFLIRMDQLEYISSAGLRSILAIAKMLKAREGTLAFSELRGPVKDVFKISGFGSIFNSLRYRGRRPETILIVFMDDNAQHIVVPAHMKSLQKTITFVSSFAKGQGFDPQRLNEIELCVEEVLVNIFAYAYPGAPGEVEISCRSGPEGALTIEIVDSGIPFNILSTDDPDISLNIDERHVGGLGIYFVKQLMDRVEYRRENNKNFLSMTNFSTTTRQLVDK